MSKEPKHHYIPKFYLKQWADPKGDGRVCEFCRRYRGVKARMTFPDGTGYVRGLYTFGALAPDEVNVIELKFLQKADGDAAVALGHLVEHEVDLPVRLRNAWIRFLMTLIHRNPEGLLRIRDRVKTGLKARLGEARDEYEAAAVKHGLADAVGDKFVMPERHLHYVTASVFQNAMDSKEVGTLIGRMRWSVVTFNRPQHTLLTSDRPIIMTNGIRYSKSHIVIPISPDTLFIAANNDEMIQHIDAICKRPRSESLINDQMARQAYKYVYAQNDSQLRFVANRLGEQRRATPFE